MSKIDGFEGRYAFLSNFYPSPVEYISLDGQKHIAPSVEHAFQASKAIELKHELAILNSPTMGGAKRRGRQNKIRPDWEQVKVQTMYEFVLKKFSAPELKEKLLATGDAELVEGNHWHDNYWGDCHCEQCKDTPGKNKLGGILMLVRERLRNA